MQPAGWTTSPAMSRRRSCRATVGDAGDRCAMLLLSTQVALAVSAIASLAFVVAYGLRSPWQASSLGRHLMAIAALFAVDSLVLLLLSIGVVLHYLAYSTIYWVGAGLAIQRVFIFFRVQRAHRTPPEP